MPDREMLEMYRKFLNGTFGSPWGDEPTDKARGVSAPPREKPYPADATLIDLTPLSQLNLGRMPVAQAIKQRRSRRQYSQDPMTLDELLGVDGRDEFTIYAAAVGKLKPGRGVDWSGQVAKVDAGEDVTRLWVKSFSWWEGDVFVVEFPAESVAGYAKGTYVGITGEMVEMCSAYDGWPLVEGSAIERQEDPWAGFQH